MAKRRMVLGKPGPKVRLRCGCKPIIKMTKRGKRYAIQCEGSKMMRFISEVEYREALRAEEVCAHLPEPFGK